MFILKLRGNNFLKQIDHSIVETRAILNFSKGQQNLNFFVQLVFFPKLDLPWFLISKFTLFLERLSQPSISTEPYLSQLISPVYLSEGLWSNASFDMPQNQRLLLLILDYSNFRFFLRERVSRIFLLFYSLCQNFQS